MKCTRCHQLETVLADLLNVMELQPIGGIAVSDTSAIERAQHVLELRSQGFALLQKKARS